MSSNPSVSFPNHRLKDELGPSSTRRSHRSLWSPRLIAPVAHVPPRSNPVDRRKRLASFQTCSDVHRGCVSSGRPACRQSTQPGPGGLPKTTHPTRRHPTCRQSTGPPWWSGGPMIGGLRVRLRISLSVLPAVWLQGPVMERPRPKTRPNEAVHKWSEYEAERTPRGLATVQEDHLKHPKTCKYIPFKIQGAKKVLTQRALRQLFLQVHSPRSSHPSVRAGRLTQVTEGTCANSLYMLKEHTRRAKETNKDRTLKHT